MTQGLLQPDRPGCAARQAGVSGGFTPRSSMLCHHCSSQLTLVSPWGRECGVETVQGDGHCCSTVLGVHPFGCVTRVWGARLVWGSRKGCRIEMCHGLCRAGRAQRERKDAEDCPGLLAWGHSPRPRSLTLTGHWNPGRNPVEERFKGPGGRLPHCVYGSGRMCLGLQMLLAPTLSLESTCSHHALPLMMVTTAVSKTMRPMCWVLRCPEVEKVKHPMRARLQETRGAWGCPLHSPLLQKKPMMALGSGPSPVPGHMALGFTPSPTAS